MGRGLPSMQERGRRGRGRGGPQHWRGASRNSLHALARRWKGLVEHTSRTSVGLLAASVMLEGCGRQLYVPAAALHGPKAAHFRSPLWAAQTCVWKAVCLCACYEELMHTIRCTFGPSGADMAT